MEGSREEWWLKWCKQAARVLNREVQTWEVLLGSSPRWP